MMTKYDYARAAMSFEAMPLNPLNREFANYWLSLWDGNTPPPRAAFNPAHARAMLPGICILEVHPGERLHCRLAGTAIGKALGADITGKDWLALTPDDQKRTRLERIGLLLAGNASRNTRSGLTLDREPVVAEEIQFPFDGVAEDGARLLISHIAWRAREFENAGIARVRDGHHIAAQFLPIPLAA